jgi:hypothetical protein
MFTFTGRRPVMHKPLNIEYECNQSNCSSGTGGRHTQEMAFNSPLSFLLRGAAKVYISRNLDMDFLTITKLSHIYYEDVTGFSN